MNLRDDRGWDGWWCHWLNGYEFEQTLKDNERQGSLSFNNETQWKQWKTGEPGVLQSMRSQKVGHKLATEQQQHIII